ncbi:MAG: hypothetical protein DHS20C05_02210 [Hyphococcus sp.]|nr:MAG: hypothetical protein DHS20C05_02210 [Marinicaulis sp.]
MKNHKMINPLWRLAYSIIAIISVMSMNITASANDNYDDLVSLFETWRAFEKPAFVDGAPDYTKATMKKKHEALKKLQKELAAFDISSWPIEQKVDYHLVRAEMNGLDFFIRVLKPWERDPAYYQQVWTYQSDTPAHEGTTNHALVELWQYDFPLSEEEAAKLVTELQAIPPLLEQAQTNLTGNARDLWISGTSTMEDQAGVLKEMSKQAGNQNLKEAINTAYAATTDFIEWLKAEAPNKTGPSGVGKENYTWHLQNVHLVPLTWEDEVMLLKRELKRAHSSLRLEEHRNRDLPELEAVTSPKAYKKLALDRVEKYMRFLEDNDIITITDYMEPALREQIGSYSPPESRNFFAQATHREPMTLWTHFYHWWDLARMENNPHESPMRRGPMLFNIFDSRAEGVATAMEEMMMHAGLYDDNPRAREIVWILQAQRAARGLASLYAQANDFTMKNASDFHVKWTPRGWMSPSLDLLGFEQQLYLRQPGYGTSYVTGKHLFEEVLADRSRQLDENYPLKMFFEEIDDAGVIPTSLIHWQLTGEGNEMLGLE